MKLSYKTREEDELLVGLQTSLLQGNCACIVLWFLKTDFLFCRRSDFLPGKLSQEEGRRGGVKFRNNFAAMTLSVRITT